MSSPDDIPGPLIKEVIPTLAPILVEIFNESLTSGQFPGLLKATLILPAFKKGDSLDINNYRPISILSFLAKVLETLVYNRLINFLLSNNAFSPCQHGFLGARP